MSVEIDNSLKVWRAKFDYTQSDLADLAGVSRKTINTLERGIYTPSVTLALKISRIFNTSVEKVFYLK
ncbi:MAG: helix-turn-helix transcriptional regulator [Proteobacteria bacterium]|nr:helix-turn-helix transcriptional regulator [Pseudomonadota bacterium]